MLLLGKPVADALFDQSIQTIQQNNWQWRYIVDLFCGDNPTIQTYLRMKAKACERVGRHFLLFGQGRDPNEIKGIVDERFLLPLQRLYTLTDYTPADVYALIAILGQDQHCMGFIPQLPFSPALEIHKYEIFDHIPRHIDVDGLGSAFIGKYMNRQLDILGATPYAAFHILDHYGLGDLKGKKVAIVGQSTLTGLPVSRWCIRRGANVSLWNSKGKVTDVQASCHDADIIISCTGMIHLISSDHIRPDKSQTVIDIGRGIKDGKAVGDGDFETIGEHLAAYTPVPGWIGPVTIAGIISNACTLATMYQKSKA